VRKERGADSFIEIYARSTSGVDVCKALVQGRLNVFVNGLGSAYAAGAKGDAGYSVSVAEKDVGKRHG